MSGLSLRGLAKSYGGAAAVRDLSLEVADGELLVLVGPSGCGKTTTLRMIAGLEQPDAGDILVGDRSIAGLAPSARDVAMVFQSYALFPHMTVYDNLAFGLAARRTPDTRIRERVGAAAEALGLEALLGRKPRQLSGGERQRVALGRAMVRDPAVFLMDEPLSNLDAQLRVRTRAEIVRLQANLRTTTIYVTHDQTEALSIGHRIGVMRDGVLQQIGTPREVYASPANVFVAGFIGSPGMNQVAGRITDGAFVWSGGRATLTAAAPGGEAVLGVRPEHVHVAGSRWSEHVHGGDRFRAEVDVVGSTGDQTFLTLLAGGTEIVARVEPAFTPARGDVLDVWFDPDRLHLFDAATGRAIE